MDNKKWQEHLDEEPYACGHESAERPYEEKVLLSEKVLSFVPNQLKNVLVVGCGDGTEVKWLKDRSFNVKGITRNKAEVISAKKRYSLNIDYGDMHELPYEDNLFDCIVAKDVFEHSIAPMIALREFYRVLKEDGWVILTMPSMEWANEFYHHSVMTHKQMEILLKKNCFEILAGPGIKPNIPIKPSVTIPLGFRQGHIDVFIAKKLPFKKNRYMLDVQEVNSSRLFKFFKMIEGKLPFLLRKCFKDIYYKILVIKAKFY